MQKYIGFFSTLVAASLLTGCAVSDTDAVHLNDRGPVGRKFSRAASDAEFHAADPVSVPDPNGLLMLGEVLALTLMHNPELSAYSLEIRAADARALQAGLRPNPELEVEMEEVGGSGSRSGFDAAETTLRISQLIETGGKAEKRQKVAAFEKDLAGIDYRAKKMQIFADAAGAFIAVLTAQEQLELSQELLTLAEETFTTVQRRVRAGRDSPIEETRASVTLADIRLAEQKARRNLTFARKKLAAFWAQESPVFERAVGDLGTIEPLPPLEQLIASLKTNPEYARWQAEIEKSRAVMDLEEANAKGDVTVGAGVQRFHETDDNALVFGISIPLPIHDRNQGARRAAAYGLAKSRQQQKAAWLALQNELNEAYRAYADAYEQAVSLDEEVLPAAANMFEAVMTAYREGKVDYLNVLDAQRTLFEAKKQYLTALSDCHRAAAEVERLTGPQTGAAEYAALPEKGETL